MATPGDIVVFCAKEWSNRLRYILKTLFCDFEGLNYTLTNDPETLTSHSGAKIAYGICPVPDIPFIPDSGLLAETEITVDITEPDFWENTPVLCYTGDVDAIVPFDILAASFWMLSRYEEYRPYTPDSHGRFSANASLAGRHNLLQTPLVDLWLEILMLRLRQLFPNLPESSRKYRFIPTIDIDSPWAYLNKPPVRQAGGLIKATLRLNFHESANRAKVLLHCRKDPFDTFSDIENIHSDYEKPIFFFLLGRYGGFNKNPSPQNRRYRSLIREIAEKNEVGIHPSYETMGNPALMLKEINILKGITGRKVLKSRQHFLRIKLPDTYEHLLSAGISGDYTMGFADKPGFRAGTCRPFRFYNLLSETETELQIYPLTLMDGTLRDYLDLQPSEAIATIRTLADKVRQHNGVFVSLWHNESLNGSMRWQEWRDVYKELVEYCSAKK